MEIKDSELGHSLANEIRVFPKVTSPGYHICPKEPINCGAPRRKKKFKNKEIIFLFLSKSFRCQHLENKIQSGCQT